MRGSKVGRKRVVMEDLLCGSCVNSRSCKGDCEAFKFLSWLLTVEKFEALHDRYAEEDSE